MASPEKGWAHITVGATIYSFKIGLQGIRTFPRPITGEIQKQTGLVRRADLIDTPWAITNFTGLGVSKADEFQLDADNRLWEGKNIQFRNGMWCLGPQAVVATDMTGVHNIIGFQSGIGKLFYYADTNALARETIAYWTGSTTTWTNATATADFEAASAGSGFPCVGMTNFIITNNVIMALRSTTVSNGAARYQLIHSNDGTTWTVPDHASSANSPSGTNNDACTGLISWFNGANLTAATLTYNSSTKVITLRTATSPAGTWADATGGTLKSNAAPQALVALDLLGTVRPFIFTQEGVWYWDTAKMIPVHDFSDDIRSNNGRTPVHWEVDSAPGGWNVYQQGRHIYIQNWPTTTSATLKYNIAPTWQTQGLPTFRDGPVTNLATAPNFLWASIGGDTTATTAGIYERVGQYAHPRGWFGPIYDLGTANRDITAMGYSALDDNVPRLHWAEENGTAGDSDPKFMANVTREPRTVTSYAHAPTGTLILPVNSRFLDELDGVLLKIMVIGTGLTASNKVADIFVSADAAPLASDGAWGTTLGAITTSGGSQNAAATPTGTGQNAKAWQIRIDLAGTSNASPYITAILIFVEKWPATRFVRILPIDVAGSVTGIRSVQKVLDDLEACQGARTYWQVDYGQEVDLVLKPYNDVRALDYALELIRSGTVGAQTEIRDAVLVGVDV